jgi:hypothetical protein
VLWPKQRRQIDILVPVEQIGRMLKLMIYDLITNQPDSAPCTGRLFRRAGSLVKQYWSFSVITHLKSILLK